MSNLRDLDDIDLKTTPPSNNDVLTYDSTKTKWISKSFPVSFEDWTVEEGETVTIIDEKPPADVSNLIVSNIDKTSITLSWTESSSLEDIKDYTIYNGTTLLGIVTGTTFDITGLILSTKYTFTVKSRDSSNNESSGISIDTKTLGNYAISMNGISDYIKLQPLIFDCIELTCSVEPLPKVWSYYLDARNGTPLGYIARNSAGTDSYGSSWSAIYINGVLKTSSKPSIMSNTKTTIKGVLSSSVKDDINIFSNSSGNEKMKGIIYEVKLYNDSMLVAHYDLTQQFTGTIIPDISGNRKVATLYGGTWITQG
ncbi:fibronectin type III domain-containing protein [Priestia aryabhattai]|uniref:fibronectin type III domain-containing protein n=1 Tax=Priestia TaxID=2800373 RepID=UPI000E1AE435|nr:MULTISPECIES: fibronectin type III domain-containing protein [Priestia]MBY0007037.1 fibronectin type III domain-containing protein [Priestia aryabhattai]MBY0048541.1 fibronectin type III domain-containing protein [Priestia aryabhattai]NLR43296.1 fibronectin type III domain-containing protein [Priestia megaterium]SUV05560.1 chitin-binding domain-containing protein [Priestia megaterium]